MRDLWGTLCTSVKQIKSLTCLIVNKELPAGNAGESGFFFQRGGNLMVFLELQREAGVCSRVTAGVDIKNFCLFSEVGTPI